MVTFLDKLTLIFVLFYLTSSISAKI